MERSGGKKRVERSGRSGCSIGYEIGREVVELGTRNEQRMRGIERGRGKERGEVESV